MQKVGICSSSNFLHCKIWELIPLCDNTLSHSGLTVSIIPTYTPPPDFVGGPSDFRAASAVTLTCEVEGATGAETYLWTSTCTGPGSNCFVPGKTDQAISRTTLRSSDSGTHICTATLPITGLSGTATIEMNVVGEWTIMCSRNVPSK